MATHRNNTNGLHQILSYSLIPDVSSTLILDSRPRSFPYFLCSSTAHLVMSNQSTCLCKFSCLHTPYSMFVKNGKKMYLVIHYKNQIAFSQSRIEVNEKNVGKL